VVCGGRVRFYVAFFTEFLGINLADCCLIVNGAPFPG